MADDMERRLQAAYASGDANAIMRCLNGQCEENEEPILSDVLTLAPEATASEPSIAPAADENCRAAVEGVPTDVDSGIEGQALSSLTATYPHADVSVLQSLFYAHAGNVDATRISLQDLDGIGALGVGGMVSESRASIHTEAYAAAVSEWDTSFPSLGGNSVARKRAPSTYGDGKLLSSVRERHLVESMTWIPRNVVLTDFRLTGNADISRSRLLSSHPKPRDWDERQAKKAEEAILSALQKASRSWSNTNDYDEDACADRDKPSRWVKSGEAVSKLYASCRERASAEAKQRNKYFELASKKARAGNGAEATRLGALGRAANVRMKALHEEAADLLWKANNPDFLREGLVDLHGLHISEAIERLPAALDAAASTGRKLIKVVFGTGHHSKPGGGAPRLRPAVIEYLQSAGYSHSEVRDGKTRLVSAVSVSLR